MTTKACSRCGEIKSLDLFARNGREFVGRCKQCAAEVRRIRRASRPVPVSKTCRLCNCEKAIGDFHKRDASRDGFDNRCKSCVLTTLRDRYSAQGNRTKVLRYRYGLTDSDYERMSISQDARCAICQSTTPGLNKPHFHVDHDHLTGAIRGLLCAKCNRALGLFKDDIELLKAAAKYLQHYLLPTVAA
jgi:hypothetical protein